MLVIRVKEVQASKRYLCWSYIEYAWWVVEVFVVLVIRIEKSRHQKDARVGHVWSARGWVVEVVGGWREYN